MKLSFSTSFAPENLKHIGYGNRPKPERDWLILLGISAVLVVASIVFNALLFLRVEHGDSVGQVDSVSSGIPASVTKVNTLFSERAAEENRYQSEYHFVDPGQSGS